MKAAGNQGYRDEISGEQKGNVRLGKKFSSNICKQKKE